MLVNNKFIIIKILTLLFSRINTIDVQRVEIQLYDRPQYLTNCIQR